MSAAGSRLHGRWLRPVLALALLVVLAELAGLLVLRARTGAWPDLAALEAELTDITGTRVGDAGAGQVPVPNQRFLGSESLHPYVGFLPRFTPKRALDHGVLLNQDAFYAPDSPVFSDPDEVFVVGVLGGSVAGRFVRDGGGAALAEALETLPLTAGREVRFAVLAFGGHKQPQGLMALNWLLSLGGRLDLALALDGFNEVALHERENHLQGVAPSFPRAWFFRVGMEELVKPMQAQLALVLRERAEAAETLAASPLRRSWLRRLLWRRADDDAAREIAAIDERLRALVAEHDLMLRGPRSTSATPAERLDELVAVWERASRQVDVLCRAHDIAYLHALQPNQYVAGAKPMGDAERAVALSSDHDYGAQVAAGYPRLRAAGARLRADGVRFHDLSDVFADTAVPVYVDDCCHVNELGNRLMAARIAALVAESF